MVLLPTGSNTPFILIRQERIRLEPGVTFRTFKLFEEASSEGVLLLHQQTIDTGEVGRHHGVRVVPSVCSLRSLKWFGCRGFWRAANTALTLAFTILSSLWFRCNFALGRWSRGAAAGRLLRHNRYAVRVPFA